MLDSFESTSVRIGDAGVAVDLSLLSSKSKNEKTEKNRTHNFFLAPSFSVIDSTLFANHTQFFGPVICPTSC
jgi:hypothetical protein